MLSFVLASVGGARTVARRAFVISCLAPGVRADAFNVG